MKRLIKKIQLISIIVGLFELCVFGVFFGLYIPNVGNMQEIFTPVIVGYISLSIAFINICLLFTVLLIIFKYRRSNDLYTAEMLGSGVGAFYKFGSIGFILVNKDDSILYVSESLKDKGFDYLNENVYTSIPELKEFRDKEDNKDDIVKLGDYYFKCKYLKSSRVFIFQDVSEYETAFKIFQKNATCLGIIMIDNYFDLTQNNEEINEIIPQIKNLISEYGKTHHLILRSYKNDSYFVLCRYEDLMEMKNEGFLLLSSVRGIGKKKDLNTSLSIGFAYDFPTLSKLNDMASSALNVAMSRGGDQVVLAQLNHELTFIGGKTEASESRNKVKVKADSNTLLNYIERNDNIIIMGHKDMDMDALGACLGLQSICFYKKKKAWIVYDPDKTETKARMAITSTFNPEEIKNRFINSKQALEMTDPTTLLLIADVNNPTQFMVKDLVDKTDKVIIIDHHRRGDAFIENVIFDVIDTSASSASELVCELIKYGSKYPPIQVPNKIATIMLSGISLDTNFFKTKSTGARTFEACTLLKEYGADSQDADNLLKDEYEEYSAVHGLLSTLKNYDFGVVYCIGPNDLTVNRATLAKACNVCIGLKDISAAFVIGRINENQVAISARSNGSVNVQIVCEKLGGGGHFTASAAQFSNTTTSKVEQTLLETLDSLKGEFKTREEN